MISSLAIVVVATTTKKSSGGSHLFLLLLLLVIALGVGFNYLVKSSNRRANAVGTALAVFVVGAVIGAAVIVGGTLLYNHFALNSALCNTIGGEYVQQSQTGAAVSCAGNTFAADIGQILKWLGVLVAVGAVVIGLLLGVGGSRRTGKEPPAAQGRVAPTKGRAPDTSPAPDLQVILRPPRPPQAPPVAPPPSAGPEPTVAYCTNCGTGLTRGTGFCTACGTPQAV